MDDNTLNEGEHHIRESDTHDEKLETEDSVTNNEEGEESKAEKKSALLECILKELAVINGKINQMNTSQLTRKLKKYNLDTRGFDDVLRRRLKNNYRVMKLSSIGEYLSKHLLPYYVVLDFEATCDSVNPPNYAHEIIEFPAVLVASKTTEIIDTFQIYCKPKNNPKLSEFCTALTGITQEQVDSGVPFIEALEKFNEWLKSHSLGGKHKFAIVTDGPWDMTRFLYSQCVMANLEYPHWGRKYVNIRKSFSSFYQTKRFSLRSMLEYLGLEFEGRPHCGLDDARNIANILIRLMCDGADIQVNEKIWLNSKKDSNNDDDDDEGEKKEIPGWGRWHKKETNNPIQARFRPINRPELKITLEDVKKERQKIELLKLHELPSQSNETPTSPNIDGVKEDGEDAWNTVAPRKHYHRKKKNKRRK